MAELAPKVLPCRLLGLERNTNEAKISTPSGVIRVRSVRRRPAAERWSSEEIRKVVGFPLDPTPGVVSREMKTAAIVLVQQPAAASLPTSLSCSSVTRMVATAEKTGRMSYVMDKVGTFYEDEGERRLTELSKLFEPLIIVIMGLIVAFVVTSILLPMLSFSKIR